jgi:hypothetical protein
MDFPGVLVGLTEIAVALAGFTGVVVVFGSHSAGSWLPGDRLRLGFLLEASLTAGGFALFSSLIVLKSGDSQIQGQFTEPPCAWRIEISANNSNLLN